MTHFADSFRYMLEGVRNSAGMVAKIGTRLGGFGDLIAVVNISRTVLSDGWTPNYMVLYSVLYLCYAFWTIEYWIEHT